VEDKLQVLVDKVDLEGLEYAIAKWSDWEELREEYPMLYAHIHMFRYYHNWLETYIEKLMLELDNE
jgi:hypothetical protein